MERSPARDFIVGIFVLMGFTAIGYLSISVGGSSWRGRLGLKLYASFTETGALTVRAPVVIAGVRVGEVSNISLEKDLLHAKVEMNLDPDLQLDEESFASIVTAGMLGDRYIELRPGAGERVLKSGDSITHTDSAIILERVISQFIYENTKGSTPAATAPAKTQ